MNSKTIKFFLLLLLGSLLTLSNIYAEGGDKGNGSNTLQKPGNPIRAYMNINFISTLIKNTGVTDIDAGQASSGLVYPKGSGQTAVYQSGFLWAANVNDPNELDPHVGGTVYREGLQSGWIKADGTVEPENSDNVRIWRVRPDIYYGGVDATGAEIPIVDLTPESVDEQNTAEAIRAQYDLDWEEWPADIGAPYADINGDGVYSPDPNGDGIYGMYQTKDVNGDPIDTVFQDVPGVPGADQTIWFVANDQAESRTSFMYGTQPMGLEQQCTIWGYSQTGALGNMFFRRYLLINKTDILQGVNPRTFDSMYVSMWSDPDVGDSGDDYAGCDTVLSVSYAYNGQGQDAIYGGTCPAVGFDFFQGPKVVGMAGQDLNKNGVDDADDYAIFKNERIGPGFINLPMTAAYYYINQDPTLTDPVQGSYDQGAVRWYRFMQGRIGLTNEPFINPFTGQQTPFTLPGDPVNPVPGVDWIDGQQFAYADRRIGMASGPFTMAPGDTQEVVVAEILAGAVTGVDRLSAVSLMKFYDQVAQVAYDNFFDLPLPPPAPVVTVAELDEEIVLDWSKDNARVQLTENSDSKGYKFQGYNVYQLPTASSSPSEGVRIATYDIIDGVGKINDLVFDPSTGSVVVLPVQFGNDVGVKRFISITEDAINQVPLVNGNRYYFAVTAYNYNSEFGIVPNNLENPLRIFTLIPHSNDPGVTLGEGNGSELEITHEGTADGIVTATIVDPTATTGDNYQVFFSSQQQIRNEEGFWIPGGTVSRNFNPNDPDTLTGTTIDIAAVYGPTSASYDLNFYLDVVHHYYGWVDGVTLEFPAGTNIIDVPPFTAGGGDPEIVILDNGGANPTVLLGITDNSQTQGGIFHEGGEAWVVRVSSETPLPLSVDWIAHDDGYAGGQNETGTTTVDEIGFESRTAELWNLQNTTAGTLTLENQSVYGGTDRWPPRSDLPLSSIDIGLDAMPVVDGFQMNVDVGFVAPINFFSVDLVEDPTETTTLTSNSSADDLDIQNYTIFGGTISSKAIDNFGVGTDELADLQQDYEYRFTGIYEETSPGIFEVTTGGQWATVFRMVNGGALADHPMNPSPGTAEPFLIKIPFEIWNVDDPENEFQVNMTFRDRERDGTERPFYAWNPVQRMYAIIVNSPYDENQVIQVDGGPDQFNDPATWVTVHYGTNYGLDAVVKITYANPIVIGTDTYSFSTTASAYSSSLAQDQTSEINVFPNPYYGFSSEEINKYNRFVTFNHLPTQANMRIFNLAGVLVRSLEKQDQGQFMYWDLNNENGLPVASGLYIVYIEMPELGTTKVLKVAIIQEDQVLDRF